MTKSLEEVNQFPLALQASAAMFDMDIETCQKYWMAQIDLLPLERCEILLKNNLRNAQDQGARFISVQSSLVVAVLDKSKYDDKFDQIKKELENINRLYKKTTDAKIKLLTKTILKECVFIPVEIFHENEFKDIIETLIEEIYKNEPARAKRRIAHPYYETLLGYSDYFTGEWAYDIITIDYKTYYSVWLAETNTQNIIKEFFLTNYEIQDLKL